MTTSQPRRRSRSISNFGSHIWVNNDRQFFSFYGRFKCHEYFHKALLNKNYLLSRGSALPGKLQPRNNVTVFIRLSSYFTGWKNFLFQTIVWFFLFFDFNGFWRENDVILLTPKFNVQLEKKK